MKKRSIEMDMLRFVALLGVILVHASRDEIFNPGTWEWSYFTWLSSAVTWQVPIYVMVSGRFFLDEKRNVTISSIWKKSIPRLCIAFVTWDIVYQIFYILSGSYKDLNIKGIMSQALVGPYHFWFLYMIVCIYAVTPFIRLFCTDKKLMEYFIMIFVVFQFLTSYGILLPGIGSVVNEILNCMKFHFPLGFTGYFILGYYLYRYPLKGNLEKILYAVGIISVIFTATVATITQNEVYTQYLKPNVILEAVALYTFFVNHVSKIDFSRRTKKVFAKIAECSFGIYLVHALLLDILDVMEINSAMINPVIMFPVMIFIGFAASMILVMIIRSIPVIGKRIT